MHAGSGGFMEVNDAHQKKERELREQIEREWVL